MFYPTRPAWIDVDLSAIVHNANEIAAISKRDNGESAIPMFILKGNACGHGVYEVAKALYEENYRYFGVAVYSEAILVREAAPQAEILILGYSPDYLAEEMIRNRIIPAIFSYEQAKHFSEAAQKLGVTATIHIKLDTGLHRIGFRNTQESADIVSEITKLPNLNVDGIFTQFGSLDKAYIKYQYDGFKQFIAWLEERGVNIRLKHISNSTIILDYPELNQDMVRSEFILLNIISSMDVGHDRVSLKDTFALRAEVAQVKNLPVGAGIGYGLTYTTTRPTVLATLPVGYADIGIYRMGNNGYVLIHGKRAPIVGGICMDQMMVDVTDIEDVKMGDIATVFGADGDDYISLQEAAARMKSADCMIIMSSTSRLPVRYWKNGELCGYLDTYLEVAKHYAESKAQLLNA